jgi:starvation-inducible DNA-binding protein
MWPRAASEPPAHAEVVRAARDLTRSRVALSADQRSRIAGLLQKQLASALDLASQIRQAYWNLVGSHFVEYHDLFERVARQARAWIDRIAQRTATLGGVPQGTIRQSAALSGLPDYTLGAAAGGAHVAELARRFHSFCQGLREVLGAMERGDLDDAVTRDTVIEILRAAELDLWLLDKHTQRA